MPTYELAMREAVLHVLGDATLYRLSVSVPASCLGQKVVTATYHRMRSQTPAVLAYEGFLEEVQLQRFRQMSPDAPTEKGTRRLRSYLHELDQWSATAFLERLVGALRGLAEEGLVREARGQWSLTLSGIEAAVDLRSVFTDVNVTALWVERLFDVAFRNKLITHLTYNCSRSAQFGEEEDLISTYFTNVLRRDGFRKRIREGRTPAFCDIKNWVYNAALSQWRDEGRDGHTRGFKGARTEKDLRQENDDDVADRSMPTESQAIFLVEDGDGTEGAMTSSQGGGMPLLDIVGGNLEEEMIHRLSWERGSALVDRIVQNARLSTAQPSRLLGAMLDGDTIKDIGLSENVSRGKAASLVTELLTSFEQERTYVALAVKVLGYIRDNPCSTKADIEAPVEEDPEAVGGGIGEEVSIDLLNHLVGARKLKRSSDGAYLITRHGEAVLRTEGPWVDLGERTVSPFSA